MKNNYKEIRNQLDFTYYFLFMQRKLGQLWALREVRSLVCSFLHQVFIADTSLAKLVHFQVGSMHRYSFT
jgi:hypothetical protein